MREPFRRPILVFRRENEQVLRFWPAFSLRYPTCEDIAAEWLARASNFGDSTYQKSTCSFWKEFVLKG